MPVRAHRANDYLKSPEDAAAYLNAALEEMGDDPRLLMKALQNVAEAQGGVSAVAREAASAMPVRGDVAPARSRSRKCWRS